MYANIRLLSPRKTFLTEDILSCQSMKSKSVNSKLNDNCYCKALSRDWSLRGERRRRRKMRKGGGKQNKKYKTVRQQSSLDQNVSLSLEVMSLIHKAQFVCRFILHHLFELKCHQCHVVTMSSYPEGHTHSHDKYMRVCE